jgi:hypothetical protein
MLGNISVVDSMIARSMLEVVRVVRLQVDSTFWI